MNSKNMKIEDQRLSSLLIPVIIGFLSFVIIYGLIPLDVTNVDWIMAGYDESDIIQHYAGWLAFRNSDWAFPLGMAADMAVGTGTIISFTDSIPIVAIFFKIFRQFLPDTFQYFGIYTLLCYILQSIAAFKIVFYKTKSTVYSSVGTVLFSFAPILMERAFRHTALGSQWFILFSIYLFLNYKDKRNNKTWLWFLLLEVLTVGIHPYFLPMVAAFAFLCMAYDLLIKKWISIVFLVLIQVITYGFGCVIGVLGSGVSSSRGGYGYYSMNLNALINPTSKGAYTWSSFLKVYPQILGNYDGFNYIGVGIIVLFIVDFLLIIFFKKFGLIKNNFLNYALVIIISILLSLFAISNVVTFNDRVFFEIPLPEFLLNLCGIFRASSRLFYPVYYLIFVYLIYLLWKVFEDKSEKIAIGILLCIVAIQIFDINCCIIEKHNMMAENARKVTFITDDRLGEVASKNKYVILEDFNLNNRMLAVWAFNNKLKTYYSVANSGTYEETTKEAEDIIRALKETGDSQESIVVTSNPELATEYNEIEGIEVYEKEGMYFVFESED